ncbi:MAG: hypothetical protein B7Z66_14540 [Chromatiales bacterium 21-64-14]|nr:MAG: hypothetical protein B7Z66_14540 [Chromatiales bacterium 21-64-14]
MMRLAAIVTLLTMCAAAAAAYYYYAAMTPRLVRGSQVHSFDRHASVLADTLVFLRMLTSYVPRCGSLIATVFSKIRGPIIDCA